MSRIDSPADLDNNSQEVFSSFHFVVIITVRFLLLLFYHFDSNFSFISWISFNSTIGLICVNLLIDFDAFCKRAECDAPKTPISRHNIYLVIYSILFDVLLM